MLSSSSENRASAAPPYFVAMLSGQNPGRASSSWFSINCEPNELHCYAMFAGGRPSRDRTLSTRPMLVRLYRCMHIKST
jgi:hypothetical protein